MCYSWRGSRGSRVSTRPKSLVTHTFKPSNDAYFAAFIAKMGQIALLLHCTHPTHFNLFLAFFLSVRNALITDGAGCKMARNHLGRDFFTLTIFSTSQHLWCIYPCKTKSRRNPWFTVLPRLVRRRTIKLMSFWIKKTINFEPFLEIFVIF